jgi:serine protease
MALRLAVALAAAVAAVAVATSHVSTVVRAQDSGSVSPKVAAIRRAMSDAALRASVAEARLRAEPAAGVVPGVLAVKFADGMDPAGIGALAADHGAERVARPPFADFHLVTVGEGDDVAAVARALAATPGVVYAEPVARRRAFYRPNDPLYKYQWNLAQLDFERTWDINTGATSAVIVAVVDGGVAFTTVDAGYQQAPDLAGTTFVSPRDFIWDDDQPLDFDGHGTHVTGTIAQSTNNNLGVAGIAFNASIMPVKALHSELDLLLGAPNLGTSALVAQAIRYAAENGAKVINLSLGGEVVSTAERDALQFAVDRGAVVVVAAGNSGEMGSPAEYPAAYAKDIEGVVAVAATDFSRTRAPYSNSNDYVELAAPGGDLDEDLNGDGFADGIVQQTIDFEAFLITGRFDQFGYVFFHGTSMAAPHVAGLSALLIDQGVTDPKAVEAALKKFATDLGPPGRDNEYGYGLINPRATLRGLGLAR